MRFPLYLLPRKLAFKQYEERKLAAEKIIKETQQLEQLFGKHKSPVSQCTQKQRHKTVH